MADNPPISTSTPETVTVDLGVDKEQLGDLNKTFDDFWAEQDQEPKTEAPAAPEGPAQETKESKAEKPPRAETKPVKVEVKQPVLQSEPPPPKEEQELTDEEIDRFALHPSNRPEVHEQFKRVKDLLKTERARAKELARERETLNTQLLDARQNAWTPEAKADYEHAAGVRRRVDFASDPYFVQNFHLPVLAQYEAILDEAVGMLPDRNEALKWAAEMKQNYRPDQLNREWWTHSVVDKVPNELDRSTLLNSISQLVKLQKERDSELTRRTGDKSAFENWVAEKVQFTQQRVQQEIMAEIGEQEKRPEIQAILARDPSRAKTADERRAIEDHNERFNQANNYFQGVMKDISANGPRAWVRASVEATKAKLLEGRVGELESELKSVTTERDQLRGELDKITGARRRIAHTTGTPPSTPDKKNNQGLSINSLDVRKAFENYNWDETQR